MGNKSASLVDLGDGVACLELHSLKQAIGPDVVSMMMKAAQEVEKNFEALVISSEAANFSVGANLMMMLMEAQDDNWDEIDLVIRQFQNANMRLKYLKTSGDCSLWIDTWRRCRDCHGRYAIANGS